MRKNEHTSLQLPEMSLATSSRNREESATCLLLPLLHSAVLLHLTLTTEDVADHAMLPNESDVRL